MAQEDARHVTDSRVLAALAHPLRRRLMDVLKVHGPSTASLLAERTGQAVANISHHVKVLAAADLVVEAPELARDRRERWWSLRSVAVRWSSSDFAADPAAEAVAGAAASLNLDHHAGMVRAWLAAAEDDRGPWTDAAFATDTWLWLTPDELTRLGAELRAVLDRWRDGSGEREDRRPVFVFAHGVPGQP